MICIVSLIFSSCEDAVNQLQTGASSEAGAYAKIVSSSDDKTTNIGDPNSSSFDATIEFIDTKSGDLVESYALYVTFKDNTIASDTAPDYSISDEVLIQEWDKSSFVTGEKYPMLSFTVKASDAIQNLGLDITNAFGGDTFIYRGEITLSDGRKFSSTNSGTSINSELFFNDAFNFTSKFVCIPTSPITGIYTLKMSDSYGDGWQGSAIVITVDGVSTNYSIPDGPNNNSLETTVTIPTDASSLTFEFIAGTYPGEVSFQILTPSGALGADEGPGPGVGTINLNYCFDI